MDHAEWTKNIAEAVAYDNERQYNDRWYVLFVTTGREANAANDVKKVFDEGTAKPFIPTIETLFKKAGVIEREINPTFPGYLFVETALPNESFINRIRECIKKSEYIMKLLRYDDLYNAAVRDNERRFLESLWSENTRCIEVSKAIIKDGKLVIVDGLLKGREGYIKKVNRHKMQAVIEFEIFNEQREITVGLEIVEKV